MADVDAARVPLLSEARNTQDGESTALDPTDTTVPQTRTNDPESGSTPPERVTGSGSVESEEGISDLNFLFDPSSSSRIAAQEEGAINEPDGKGVSASDGQTPKLPYQGTLQERLLIALQNGDFEIFENLLDNKRVKPGYKYKKLAVKKYSYKTCLEIACCIPKRSKFIRALLKKHVRPNVNRIIPEPIHWAARNGFFDSLQVLVENKGTRVYAIDSKGRTALHFACSYIKKEREKDYCKCIELLFNKMSLADINKPDINGFTAFHALLRGNWIISRDDNTPHRRKSNKINKDEKDTSQDEAKSETEELTFILEEREMRSRVARKLLEWSRGSLDVDSSRARGRSAREEVEKLYPELENLLPLRMDSFRFEPHTRLAQAILDGRINDFRALLDQTDVDGYPVLNPNYIFEGYFYSTCLELACEREDGEEFVLALLEANADPNIPNKTNSKFPIHIACEKGHYLCLKILLDYGADVNCINKSGSTPLHITLELTNDDSSETNSSQREFEQSEEDREGGKQSCFEILLNSDILDVNKKNGSGKPPLMIAVESKNKFAVHKALYDKKHNWNIDVDVGGQQLHELILMLFNDESDDRNRKDIVHQLERMRRISYANFQDRTEGPSELFALLYSRDEFTFVERIKELLDRNIQFPLDVDDGKFTLLQHASYYGNHEAVKALLDADVDPNKIFKGNQTPPIILAASENHNEVLNILLETNKCNVNITDDKGNTALHFIARSGNLDSVVHLLRHGADLQARNKLGKLPFDEKQARMLLDQCVKTNMKKIRDEKFELIFDYRLLAPGQNRKEIGRENSKCHRWTKRRDKSTERVTFINVPCDENEDVVGREMKFLDMISSNEEMSELLHHPVAWSFLHLKWKRVRHLTFFNLFLYFIFILSLNVFIINSKLQYSAPSMKNETESFESENNFPTKMIIFGILTALTWTFIFIREVTQYVLDQEYYLKSYENYVDWSVLLLSLSAIILPFHLENSEINREILSWVNVLTIMLSCTELLILLGRLTYFAKNIEMLKVVMKSYFWPLLSYFVILVAFGLSFHTLYHESNTNNKEPSKKQNETESTDFKSWYMSIAKSLVMMTGELEFESFRERTPLSVLLFMVFVLLVTLVLCNLLTGLAVSDTQKIEIAAQRLRLQTRVGVVLRIERTLVNWLNGDCALARCAPVPRCLRQRLRRSLLFVGNTKDVERVGRVKLNVNEELQLGSGEHQTPNSGEQDEAYRSEGVTLGREALRKAVQIHSERSAAAAAAAAAAATAAAPTITLADIYAKVTALMTKHDAMTTKQEVLVSGQADLLQEIRRATLQVGRHSSSLVSTPGLRPYGDWDIDECSVFD